VYHVYNPATQEVEIWRIEVRDQSGQKSNKVGMVVHVCYHSCAGDLVKRIKNFDLRPALGKNAKPYLENNESKKSMASTVPV
jgi:hypothetical protein